MDIAMLVFSGIGTVIATVTLIGLMLGFVWKRLDRRFDKIDERFTKLEDKFDNLAQRVARIEGKMDLPPNLSVREK
jgi:hypothetical protein